MTQQPDTMQVARVYDDTTAKLWPLVEPGPQGQQGAAGPPGPPGPPGRSIAAADSPLLLAPARQTLALDQNAVRLMADDLLMRMVGDDVVGKHDDIYAGQVEIEGHVDFHVNNGGVIRPVPNGGFVIVTAQNAHHLRAVDTWDFDGDVVVYDAAGLFLNREATKGDIRSIEVGRNGWMKGWGTLHGDGLQLSDKDDAPAWTVSGGIAAPGGQMVWSLQGRTFYFHAKVDFPVIAAAHATVEVTLPHWANPAPGGPYAISATKGTYAGFSAQTIAAWVDGGKIVMCNDLDWHEAPDTAFGPNNGMIAGAVASTMTNIRELSGVMLTGFFPVA